MKKRFLGVLLSVAMVAAVLAGCGSSGAKETAAPAGSETEAASEAASGETEAAGNTGDVITVGFSQVGAESDWRTANSESMKSTFSTENGYNLIFDDAQQKQENQIAAIRNFIQQEVDYIVLAPADGIDACKKALTLMKFNRFQDDFMEGMACEGGCRDAAGLCKFVQHGF